MNILTDKEIQAITHCMGVSKNYESIAQAQLDKCTEELNQWKTVPDSEGWWWFSEKWREPVPKFVTFTQAKGFRVEIYEEADNDLYECKLVPVARYTGEWCKCFVPEEK
jgi:hypothetical protein